MSKVIHFVNPSIVEMRNDPSLTDYIKAQVEEICEADQVERFIQPVDEKYVPFQQDVRVLETYRIIKNIDYVKIYQGSKQNKPIYLVGCHEFSLEMIAGEYNLTFTNMRGETIALIPEMSRCEVSAHKKVITLVVNY